MMVKSHAPFIHGGHVVHFHNDDDDFIGVIGAYLTAALLDNDAVVVIASEAHRAAFETVLTTAREGSVVLLDAAHTLSQFMVDGSPDAEKFEQVVGDLVRGAGHDGRHVRAYGEMVAVLWQSGNLSGAIELERLWNALGERIEFSLFCAYPLHLATDPDAGDAYAELCHLHSVVVGGAPASADCEVTRRFPATPHASRQARRFIDDTLTAWGRLDLLNDCLLIGSELVTNAVQHAGSDVTVSLSRTDDGVTVAVGDASSNPPIARIPSVGMPGGRGLHLVDGVSRRWGHSQAAAGKFVWADVAVSG